MGIPSTKQIIIVFSIFSTLIIVPTAIYGQSIIAKEDIDKTLGNGDNRKSFGYCPIRTDTTETLAKYGVEYTIEGCPMSRIYIDNWDKLDDSTRQQIFDELNSLGFRMENN